MDASATSDSTGLLEGFERLYASELVVVPDIVVENSVLMDS